MKNIKLFYYYAIKYYDIAMTEHGICPGPSICYIYSGIKLGEILSVHKFTNEIYS
jgi:hypothetical protein